MTNNWEERFKEASKTWLIDYCKTEDGADCIETIKKFIAEERRAVARDVIERTVEASKLNEPGDRYFREDMRAIQSDYGLNGDEQRV